MFDQASLYGNKYMMVIIDTKRKYVWDYFIKTKDQVYEKIPGTLAKGLAGAHFGEKDQMKLKNETVG